MYAMDKLDDAELREAVSKAIDRVLNSEDWALLTDSIPRAQKIGTMTKMAAALGLGVAEGVKVASENQFPQMAITSRLAAMCEALINVIEGTPTSTGLAEMATGFHFASSRVVSNAQALLKEYKPLS